MGDEIPAQEPGVLKGGDTAQRHRHQRQPGAGGKSKRIPAQKADQLPGQTDRREHHATGDENYPASEALAAHIGVDPGFIENRDDIGRLHHADHQH